MDLRNKLWPDVPADWLWSRHTHDGFTTMPKGLPLIMSIMDDLAKGQPVSSTYIELWCRTFDENFVVLSKPREMAFHAGFDGQRAERTWRQRLQILDQLHFISLAEGPSGPASYALIYNPYKVIEWHKNEGTAGLRKDKYHALLERSAEIGDESLMPPAPPEQPAVAAPTPAPAAMPAPTATPLVTTAFGPAMAVPPPSNWPGGVAPTAKTDA
ncbi:hypothetical protein [Bradyrhizobium elkanii]|uniref:hypothetical protein n=1 Tax=Bradyrhizobium elkanii TaxID=29448 RepID=UPI003D20F39D